MRDEALQSEKERWRRGRYTLCNGTPDEREGSKTRYAEVLRDRDGGMKV
jgi:hypothetical protein